MKSYGDIINRIEMNNEMKNRILKNIQNDNYKSNYLSKRINFYDIKEYVIIAACFVLLVGITVYVPKYMSMGKEQVNSARMMSAPVDIIEYASAEELSNALGFEMNDISVPFDVLDTTYTEYFNNLGQIYYNGENQSLTLRKSLGEYDNSGDYTQYTNIVDVVGDGIDMTLKGNSEAYNLALWQKDGFSYSLRFANAVSREEFVNIINNIH